jgi:hypothetical protein
VTGIYAERMIPLGLTLVLTVSLVWWAFWFPAAGSGSWLAKFQRAAWPLEVTVAASIVAQVATWRGWYWPLRLLLHAGWFALLVFART